MAFAFPLALALALALALPRALAQSCPAGTYGAGGVAPCTPCAGSTYALGGASACAPCAAAGSVFVSATAGCAPASAANGPVDSLVFFFSGAQADSVTGFSSSASSAAGISYTTDRLGAANRALALPVGAHLDSDLGALALLPANSSDASIAAFVSCTAIGSPEASVIEFGLPGFAASSTKIGLSVAGTAPAAAPGPIEGACDGRWHHLAVVKSASVVTQYLDGIAVKSSNVTLIIPTNGSSLRIGWNGNPIVPNPLAFTTVGTSRFVAPPGVVAVDVLVVGGGGGGGGTGSACRGGGGGGGGGFICTTLSLTPGQAMPVTVGAGGLGGYSGTANTVVACFVTGGGGGVFCNAGPGGTGLNSSFGPLVALGGGGGGSFQASTNYAPTSGASGGGAGCTYCTSTGNKQCNLLVQSGNMSGAAPIPVGQGNAGGWNFALPGGSAFQIPQGGGGGGGAGTPGANGSIVFAWALGIGGVGGDGLQCPTFGSAFFGGGGGGSGNINVSTLNYISGGLGGGGAGVYSNGATTAYAIGRAGTPNSGGGGGGGANSQGGPGGSGVVMVSWVPPSSLPANAYADATLGGAVSDMRVYSRALSPAEVLQLSQPPLILPGANNPAPEAGAASYSWTQCGAGFFGTVSQTMTRNAATNAWTTSGGASNTCSPCPAGTGCAVGTTTAPAAGSCPAGYCASRPSAARAPRRAR